MKRFNLPSSRACLSVTIVHIYHKEGAMSRRVQPRETTRQWLSGVAVMVATVVSFIGFARVSIGWTLALSTIIVVGLVIFLWAAGVRKQRAGVDRRKRV